MEKAKNISSEQSRMEPEQSFRFRCSPGVLCFTRCCQDVTIALTPYDVLRLKDALEIPSGEFLDRYTIILPKEGRIIPVVVLKMNEGDKKCPFVTENGCTVYESRPWPCRMYPLDMNDDGTFRLITDSTRCLGLKETESYRITDWLLEQGIPIYDQMNQLFAQITIPLRNQEGEISNVRIKQMTFMALYNLDKFKEFIFQSSFLQRFEVSGIKIEKIRRSDLELLKFGFDWVKFGIFGQKTFVVKQKSKVR